MGCEPPTLTWTHQALPETPLNVAEPELGAGAAGAAPPSVAAVHWYVAVRVEPSPYVAVSVTSVPLGAYAETAHVPHEVLARWYEPPGDSTAVTPVGDPPTVASIHHALPFTFVKGFALAVVVVVDVAGAIVAC